MERATKKIVIDPKGGGEDIGNVGNGITEKDFNLEISKYILSRLGDLGIEASITRDSDITLDNDERINKIKGFYGTGNDVIVISNALTSNDEGTEIVYALRNSSGLSENISSELKKVGIPINKYYQRRLPTDTSKDYNQIIRDTKNNQTIIIYYGNVDSDTDSKYLKNNLEELGEAVVIGLTNYLNVNYVPKESGNYYKVQKGDSLYSIAKKYNTSVSELVSLNKLSSTNLKIGQILKVPTIEENNNSNISSNTYIVKKGDSLYSIAKEYNTTVDNIKKLNNLTSNLLSIGQILKIPSTIKEDTITYTVKSGDSLYSIARKYNTTVDNIKKLNNLTSNLLSIGQVLKIPNNEENYITYTVKSGDSLYSIARKYNTTVDNIKKLNNLTSNLLSIGQVLKIPNNEENYITYTVKSGDSLYSIARKYNTTVDNIKKLNNLTSNLLSINQVLKIPATNN